MIFLQKKLSNKLYFFIAQGFLITSLFACSPEEKQPSTEIIPNPNKPVASIELRNANNFAIEDEPVYYSFYQLGLTEAKPLEVIEQGSSKKISGQLIDRDGDEQLDGFLFLQNLQPGEQKNLQIQTSDAVNHPAKRTQAEISIKEGGKWEGAKYVGGQFKNVDRLLPPAQYTDHSFYIRYEGPGIESDKIGYRVYLDWRNGFDIFGKKQIEPVLHKVGQDGYDSYHQPADWGQDILKVGESLGAGGFGFWNGTQVDLVKNTRSREAIITNNGELFSAFKICYVDWQVNNQKINLDAHLSVTAGSRLLHVQLTADQRLPNFAIGFVKHPETQLIQGPTNITGSAWTYVASWGKQSLSSPEDQLGMAVIFRRGERLQQTEDKNSYVSVMKDNGGQLDYYFTAAWDKDTDAIKSAEEFKAYLDREIERLTKQPRQEFESQLSQITKQQSLTAERALFWSQSLANSELERKTLRYAYQGWDDYRKQPAEFEYDAVGLQIQALLQLNELKYDPRYWQTAKIVTGSFITETGSIHTYEPDLFSIDLINPGRVLILLEQKTGEKKYRAAVDYLRGRLKLHPRTSEGAFWHRVTYPNQLWLDGVYMGIPFLVQYAAAYETGATRHASFKEAVHEFEITRKHLRNAETGLYIHAFDESRKAEWANPQTGLAPEFWSRGMGWFAMAIVDVLDYLPPKETELRNTMIEIAQEFAAGIVAHQDPETGTWWQITNKPDAIGNYRESTATAMFSYFLAKATHKGYLPDTYKTSAIKAYQGLINEFVSVHTDGKISMDDQCLVAGLGFGRDGSYNYYQTENIVSNDLKGNGPFIMAGVEVAKLLKQQNAVSSQ